MTDSPIQPICPQSMSIHTSNLLTTHTERSDDPLTILINLHYQSSSNHYRSITNPRQSMPTYTDVSQIAEGTSTIPDPTGLTVGRLFNPLTRRLRNTSIQFNVMSIKCQSITILIQSCLSCANSSQSDANLVSILCQSIANSVTNQVSTDSIIVPIQCQRLTNPPIRCQNPGSIQKPIQCPSLANLTIHNQYANRTPIQCQSSTIRTDISQKADGTSTIGEPTDVSRRRTIQNIHVWRDATQAPILPALSLPIQCQSWDNTPIHYQFVNPMPISNDNSDATAQFLANHGQISHQSTNPLPIYQWSANPMTILGKLAIH